MIIPCTACDQDKLVTDFEYQLDKQDTLQRLSPCNDCRLLTITDPVEEAKQKYYAAMYTLIVLGQGSARDVSRRERLQREYGGLLERIQKRHAELGLNPLDSAVTIEFYRKLTYNLNAQIKRHAAKWPGVKGKVK